MFDFARIFCDLCFIKKSSISKKIRNSTISSWTNIDQMLLQMNFFFSLSFANTRWHTFSKIDTFHNDKQTITFTKTKQQQKLVPTSGVSRAGDVVTARRSGRASNNCRGRRGARRGQWLLSPMMMPVVSGSGCWCGAQQVVENVNDGADVTLRSAMAVLQRGIQRAAERARVNTLAVVMHTFDYCPLSAPCIFLGEKKTLVRHGKCE